MDQPVPPARRRPRLVSVALAVWLLALLAAPAGADDPPTLRYFGTETCPYCRSMQPFLDDLEAEYPGLVVARYDVSDRGHAARWEQEMAARGEQAQGVPTAILGERVWVGFSEEIGAEIATAVAATPGVDAPSEATAEVPEASSGPPLAAIVLGAVVVVAVAAAMFAPRRAAAGDDG